LFDRSPLRFSQRTEVKERAFTFSNGTSIRCDVVVHRVSDEVGNEKTRGYSIKKVYAVFEEVS